MLTLKLKQFCLVKIMIICHLYYAQYTLCYPYLKILASLLLVSLVKKVSFVTLWSKFSVYQPKGLSLGYLYPYLLLPYRSQPAKRTTLLRSSIRSIRLS